MIFRNAIFDLIFVEYLRSCDFCYSGLPIRRVECGHLKRCFWMIIILCAMV